MALLERMRQCMHAVVNCFTAVAFQYVAGMERWTLMLTIRLHGMIENVFNAADVCVHGTGVRRMVNWQLVHAMGENRHQDVNFEQKRHTAEDNVKHLMEAISEFYQQETVWPFALFHVGYRIHGMLVAVLMYVRATYLVQKAEMNVEYCRMLVEQHEMNFLNDDF